MKFSELNLSNPLLNALNDLQITHPTTIQQKVFSVLMSGRDIIGIAQTGTGKTFAYLLPVLRQWKFAKKTVPTVLIIVPTRELVVQVVKQCESLTTYMNVKVTGVYGGANIKTQQATIYKGVDIIIGTPGRLLDIVLTGVLRLNTIKKFIIDEVDEMLNLGFRPQLIRVLDLLPPKRQNMMFSATITDDVEALTHEFFNRPEKIEAAPTGTPLEQIQQSAYTVANFNTKINLAHILLEQKDIFNRVLIFTATKKQANNLYEKINELFPEESGVIHSNKSQNNRFKTVERFKNGTTRILIATDIIARGLDISEVSHVVNFNIPEIPETYMHRIGRTGRVDKPGIAISIFSEKELDARKNIESLMNMQIPENDLPENLEISDVLTAEELPQIKMPNVQVKLPAIDSENSAFQEKKQKNKKEKRKLTRAMKQRKKYKKPKTRGQKR